MIRVRVGKLGKRGPKPLSNPRHRLWQIDAVRGMAVVCMVFYHFMWDMMFFGLYPHDVTSGGWRLFARSVAITFLVLVGVSMVLTAQRKRPAERNRQWLERGAKVFGWGLLISVVTRIFLGEAFVLYGILHLIGTAFLLAPLLWRIRRWTPLLGAGVIALGVVLADRSPEMAHLLPYAIPLGVRPEFYPAVDYFPVFPWLGVIMLGMGAGQLLAPALSGPEPHGPASAARPEPSKRQALPGSPPPVLAQLAAIGRRALIIYILHQPVLLAAFMALGYTVW